MTLLGDALNDLYDALSVDGGVSVSVERDGAGAVPLTCIKGGVQTLLFGDEEHYGTSKQSDFIFNAAEYEVAVGSRPERGDFITWTDDASNDRRFEVGVDGAERQWDDVGQFGHLIRVHTTEVTL